MENAAVTDEREAFAIQVALAAKLNLADFQNAVPLLRELCVINQTAAVSRAVELRIESVPAFLKARRWRIEELAPDSRYHIADLDVQLDGALLSRLTEAEQATLFISLHPADDADQLLARQQCPVELLPRNQWGGLTHQPDLVAAFVQPNEAAVERLLKQTAEVLRKNGKDPALDGYRGGPKRAWELTAATWNAVAAMGLDYALPPASFENTGQKVRGPAQIAESGLATCLDLALLFCSAIEQLGLNPLLVFTQGHAFAGVWLKEEAFSTVVVDDVTALRKRIKLRELVLFETTLATQHPAPPFSYASEQGARQIAEGQDKAFLLAIDVRRARLQRIKPLASAKASVPAEALSDTPAAAVCLEEAPELPEDEVSDTAEPAALNPKDRLARWQRKLLDLSLRNNLLNFRGGKKSIALDAPDPGALEDLLSDGHPLKLLPRPDLMDGMDERNQAIYESREREDVRRGHALDALQRREVFVSIAREELESRLVELYRAARAHLQEGGANTLFLAIGFLAWNRNDRPGQRYKAPLILVPVSLNRKSVRSGFSLTLHDDEPRFNPTLIEMLRQDFKLNLGVADGELPKDEHGLDVAAIWKSVFQAVKDIKGWEVTEEVSLALFSFAKHLMWKDLTERTDQLRDNPVVRHLIDTPREPYPSTVAFPQPRKLDREYRPEQTFCPLAADSSQLSAVMAAARGKDFVLIGPPGTGKSQTIANLIAQCLAEGKRVLFVSEKIAALDVVYRRLREVNLGEFCLELHSNKARKLDVLAQLQKSWDAQGNIDPLLWQTEATRLQRLRDDLNAYVERLHFKRKNGLSLFDAIASVAAGADVLRIPLSWVSAMAHDQDSLNNLRALADRLEVNAAAVGWHELTDHPMAAVAQGEWSPGWQQNLMTTLAHVVSIAQAMEQQRRLFLESAELPATPSHRQARGALAVLARILPQAAGKDWRFVLHEDANILAERLSAGSQLLAQHQALNAKLSPAWSDALVASLRHGIALLQQRRQVFAQIGRPWHADLVTALTQGLALLEQIRQAREQLSVAYSDAIEQANVQQWQRDWTKAEKSLWPLSWLGKRRVFKQLAAMVAGEGEPDVAKDLALWLRIRQLRADVAELSIGHEADSVWSGLKTKPHLVHSTLSFREIWLAARQEQPWQDSGFDAIADGRCGEALAQELARLRQLKSLDVELQKLEPLARETDGLWAGLASQTEILVAALDFMAAMKSIRESGPLPGEHGAVAEGRCGAKLAADYQHIRQRSALERQLADYDDLRQLTAGLWQGLATRSNEVETALKFQASLASAVAHLADTPEAVSGFKAPLFRLLGEANALLSPQGRIAQAGAAYLKAWSPLPAAVDQLGQAGEFSEQDKTQFSDLPLPDLLARCQAMLKAEHRLRTWCAWRKAKILANEAGLATLVSAMENGSLTLGQVARAFETNYGRWWLNATVDQEPVIRGFVSAEHEKRIRDFRSLDDRYTELTRAWVRARLCAGLPSQDGSTKSSEWGVLRHEISKKKRHLPLRELMARIPSALTKLTPCLLMSPLSIAQFLAPDATAFDVVVFDEASQIPVWDAIGAIARGKQVVMVGDPKQLPPTSFFDRAESEEDDEDVEGDLESILDECMGANLPTLNLAWHYRSRHESLIAFSNHHYYEGGLVTFPSPVTEDRAVSFHFVAGEYEKGGARINKAEAKALVADIVARLKSPTFRQTKQTIGVVTFNTEQQALIEDLLDEERRKDPAIEPWFAESELEPVFVKNLESVQGDERDIMYFSITYGPDLRGQVSMNFGPMNRNGGERRLNVAITRARHELRVFSSLKAEQMDLSRTQALGVRDLKHFLEFAERGSRALAEAATGSMGGFDSPFEAAVAQALARKGWQLHTQVGASAFRIDLAVVHPDAQGIYLTGIECDGASYHRSATARDRDKLREQVLRGLGWTILRVWSTDWWIDSAGTLEKLHQALTTLLATSRSERAAAEARRQTELAAAQLALESAQATSVTPATELQEEIVLLPAAALPSAIDANSKPQASRQNTAEVFAGPSRSAGSQSVIYRESDPRSAVDAVMPDAFFEPAYEPTLSRMIAHVIAVEGPVLDAVLARRIARAHGWQRTGARIRDRVLSFARAYASTEEDIGQFFWPPDQAPDSNIRFRRPSQELPRVVDEICLPELLALAKQVAASGKSGEELVQAMAHELGLQVLRAGSRERLEKAIAKCIIVP